MNTKGRMSQINDERPLTKICSPGSHDAGMYHSKIFEVVKTFVFPLTKASALIHTQRLDMKGRLERGVRYFEVSSHYLISPVTLINKLISRLNIILDLDFLIAPIFAFLGLKDNNNNLSGSLEESGDDNLKWHFESLGGKNHILFPIAEKRTTTRLKGWIVAMARCICTNQTMASFRSGNKINFENHSCF